MSECAPEQFWEYFDVGGVRIARCVSDCADFGAVDVATRECVRPGACRFVVFGESVVSCYLECPREIPLRLKNNELSSETWPVYECVAACAAPYAIIDPTIGYCVDTCDSLLYDARKTQMECLPRRYVCEKAVRVGNQRKCVDECPAVLPWLGTDGICTDSCVVY